MSRLRTKATERILAALLSILMVFTMIPMSTLTAFAAGVPGVISTDIESKTFAVGTTTNFTYTTTTNDDVGKYVKGSFAIKDTDTGLAVNIADVAKLEYQEYPSGIWYEFYGDFGPETGFPMTDATSNFRVTFTQKGNYTVDVTMKAVEDNSPVCTVSSDIVVNGQPSILTTDIGEKSFNVGDPTEFAFGIIANDDAGKYIFGSFEIKNKDTGETVNIADIAKLEYKESGTGIWYEFYGDFGPAGTGFPMTDATSHFRVTFRTKGNYTVIVKAKSATDSTIYSQVSNDIVVEHKVDVSAPAVTGGSIKLNSSTSDKITVDAGTDVDVTITPDTGYQVKSVLVNDISQTVSNKNGFVLSLTGVSEDTKVEVVFVKVYTVSVNISGNGTVEMTPSGEAGSVTVETGTNVELDAIPAIGHHVSEVEINGTVQTDVTNANDSGYTKILTANEAYTVKITFAPNVYSITYNATVNGSLNIVNSNVKYLESTKVYILPDSGYTVETATVNGVDVTSAIIKDDTGIYFNINDIAENKTVVVTFKQTASCSLDDVAIDPSDVALRKTSDLYVIKTGDAINFEVNASGYAIALFDENGVLIGGGETAEVVQITSNKTVSTIKIYYKADGEWYKDWHEVACDIKVVVDTQKPEAGLLLSPLANANGYHNSDVTFTVTATDGGDYSGLVKAEYWITKDTVEGARTEFILDGNAIKAGENTFVVNASTYNSADVKVNVRVVDKAGNEETFTKFLKINSTAPSVSLDIDGTKNTNAKATYYNDKRVLTITVEDRADTFDSAAVAAGLKIKKNGTDIVVADSDITWTNPYAGVYQGTYTFDDDAKYEWTLSYTNKAGMTNSGFKSAPTDKDLFAFTVDKAEPYNLKISYNPTFVDTVLETITFGFYKAPVVVTIEATDDTAGISSFKYSYTLDEGANGTGAQDVTVESGITYDGQTACATFQIDAQFRGKVSFSATDRAGRTTSLTDTMTVVVDTIAPGITVEYDPVSSGYGKYYNGERTATIKITEENFFQADLDDGLLVITVGKTLNNGTSSITDIKPTFVKNGTVYEATVVFNEEADYTFDIKYTDRAGNVYDSYPMDEFTVDTINPEIEIEFDNNACINTNNFKENRTATITITEHNFDASKVVASVQKNGVSTDEFTTYLQNTTNWTLLGNDVYTASITFADDAKYTFDVSCKDLAGNDNNTVTYKDGTVAANDFIVDKASATDLEITYNPTFVGTFLDAITFGFYKAPVEVTIEADDAVSGVDYFVYSYTVQTGASSINTGASNVPVAATRDGDTDRYYATFTIPAQFRGFVSFNAFDKAGNEAGKTDTNAVVVDTIAPGITVQYNNNTFENNNYFKADRTATITINEANFFQKDLDDGLLVITVGKRLNNESAFTYTDVKPTFAKNGDIYTATVAFNENADYTFDIKYTDRAGNVYDSYTMDEFTVDKIQPELSIGYDNNSAKNGTFYKADREATITVTEHNFRASDVEFTISATDVTETQNITLTDYAAYLKNQANWTQVGDVYTAKIMIDVEGNYTFGMTYSDLAGNAQVSAISDAFCLDKSDSENLKITYNPTFIGTVLETLTFGFYKAPVEVTIEATDDYAGVDYFVYSYTVQTGASSTNTGVSNVQVAATRDGSTNRYYTTFSIPAQFRGNVSFTAFDKAGNDAFLADDKVVVVDNVAPGVNVVYDNNSAKYDKYYDADRTATITITEANFFQKDLDDEFLVITVEKTLNDGTYTSTKMKPTFVKNGDVYTATIDFTEDADYTFDIKYTDRSGNVYDNYDKDEFTIDKIKPVISVAYDNNTCKNGNQFKADRTATITITEHNFIASDVVAKVKASGVEVDSYATYLANDANWTHNGDVHTAVIKYTDEAHYEFSISCSDKAGNMSGTVNYGTSVAPTQFTLDKSAPTDLAIKVNDTSVLGTTSIAFDTFYKGSIAVKLSANCDISGLESLKYQKVSAVSEYDVSGTWLDYNATTGIVVSPSEKFIIYFRAEDRAGNVSIVNSTGIVVDDKAPIGETKAPEIDILPAAPNANNIHNGDVKVDLKVVDPKYTGENASATGHYSGIEKITYRIYTTDTTAEKTGVLLDETNGIKTGADIDADNLISGWAGSITVDAETFNSNNVIVEVTAVDNAGNTRTSTTIAGDIQIDVTKPTIDVTYNNNEADSNTYFKDNRTATIVITERNFNEKDVVITLKNSDGEVPKLSAWKKTAGTGNLDDTKWTATLTYTTDGDYEFAIEYTDLAEWKCEKTDVNYGESVAPTEFTIDHTIPTIEVTYDNNEVLNNNYYKADRTATIVITEHNFDELRVDITLKATDDGKEATKPTVSAWKSEGDKHIATIHYGNDSLYTFDIAIKDMAGNDSVDFTEQSFYVDKTAPTLTITGVANLSANNGDVIPVVSYSDTNYDADKVEITLSGANRKGVTLDGNYADIHNGRTFTFNNFAKEKEIDDIYTLTATLTDKAGNTTTETITFSVNRFGSTYALSESAEKLNGTYVKEPVDVVITETNADILSNIKITLFKDSETIVLTEGVNYKIDVEGGNGQWYHYTYTIFAKNFEADGVYSLTVESDDKAGNEAKNDQDTKNTAINFGVDSTLPIINIENLESKTTYALDNMTVTMSVKDNLKLTKVIVELDGKEYKVWTGEELEEIIKNGGNFTFDIAGDSTDAHNLVVYAIDAAGNGEKISDTELPANAEEVVNFYVTTNLWVRYYTNKPLFFGSIAGVIVLAGLIVFLVVYKKKKNEK